MKPWYGVDLDGTLAYYDGWKGEDHIGKPIPNMVKFTKILIEFARNQGAEVRIFTARVCVNNEESSESGKVADKSFADKQRQLIQDWCKEHIGTVLDVTNEKDFGTIHIFDDRATHVVKNQGVLYPQFDL